jgi:hypothetical protein
MMGGQRPVKHRVERGGPGGLTPPARHERMRDTQHVGGANGDSHKAALVSRPLTLGAEHS